MIGVGIVGLGLASSAHAKGFRSHPRSRIVGVCDTDPARARAFAEAHGAERVHDSLDALLEDPEIDLVDIATPTDLHAEMTRRAALAGKDVHCEKPFCRSIGEGRAACAAARARGVTVAVGETYVFLSSHVKARELIDAGEVGRPLQMRQRQGAWYRRPGVVLEMDGADRSWRVDGERSGGGDYPWIFDHAVHAFATAEYLMGGCRVSEVHALAAEASPEAPARRGAEHDPYVNAEVDIPLMTWRYEDADRQGVWARAERLNGKYDFMHGFSTAIIGEKGMIEVLGEGGHNLLWGGEQCHLILHREGRDSLAMRFDEGGDDVWASDVSYYGQGHVNQIHDLIDAITAGRRPRHTAADGIHTVRCTLAAIRSARERRPVSVAEITEGYTAY
jgi:predicted dehydrogenase